MLLYIQIKGNNLRQKEDKEMTKTDFLNKYREYIGTLQGAELKGEELRAWIRKEGKDYGEELTEEQINWIAEEVEAQDE